VSTLPLYVAACCRTSLKSIDVTSWPRALVEDQLLRVTEQLGMVAERRQDGGCAQASQATCTEQMHEQQSYRYLPPADKGQLRNLPMS
jgi:hypothetical protein